MTRLIAMALVLAGAFARADEPKSTPQQLARFAFAGCDYLSANGWDAKARKQTADSKLAAHFGHVIKKEPSGMVLDYRLRVPGFVDWEITYSSFIVTLKPPSTVMLTLRDLERVFGPSEAPDWDNAKPGATVAGAEPSYEQLEFAHPAGRRTCVIGAMVADTQGDASTRRVLSFFFSD